MKNDTWQIIIQRHPDNTDNKHWYAVLSLVSDTTVYTIFGTPHKTIKQARIWVDNSFLNLTWITNRKAYTTTV